MARAVTGNRAIRIAVGNRTIRVAVGDLAILDGCAGRRGRVSTHNGALAIPQPRKQTEREGVRAEPADAKHGAEPENSPGHIDSFRKIVLKAGISIHVKFTPGDARRSAH
jgi:hypothetical protein